MGKVGIVSQNIKRPLRTSKREKKEKGWERGKWIPPSFSFRAFLSFLLLFCVCHIGYHLASGAEPPSVFLTTSFPASFLPRHGGRVGEDPGNEVVFLSDKEKRRLCLNRIKTFKLPQPKLLD